MTDSDGVDEFVHSFLGLTASSVQGTEKTFEKFVITSGIYKSIFDPPKANLQLVLLLAFFAFGSYSKKQLKYREKSPNPYETPFRHSYANSFG